MKLKFLHTKIVDSTFKLCFEQISTLIPSGEYKEQLRLKLSSIRSNITIQNISKDYYKKPDN